ncbi:hypothetical protein FPQ18DRAFT_314253 [Pyronema domesticum]|uniref:Similar to Uncharacterized protein C13G7.09c acc. no. Q10273 n=1 Tax=Pyronema omphalodes (strain CBS 100304) TaxID=1076935 RepID=U4LEZ3_PYROM|nr:hypothetical protein FPQ18DRAFT_314253 [Pyronema domesticum]CCX13516.1 Similar to Uncharacterized protein C13G7.09c; acc. no. Q10273 [Pyronema omphalodes CBS 100304]
MDPLDDDDFVANLLKNEAKTKTNTYQLHGLSGLLPSRSTGSAPKPNTRFLRNIVRDVDSHNTALIAKEAAEAKARFQRLQNRAEGRLSRSPSPRRRDDRSRSPDEERSRHRRRRSRHRSRSKDRHGRREDDKKKSRRWSHSRSSERSKTRYHHSSRRKDYDRERRKRSRSRSREDGREKRSRRSRRSRSRSRDDDKRSRRKDHDERRDKERSRRHRSSSRGKRKQTEDRDTPGTPNSTAFSDPLDEIIGPAPPPKPQTRGRGATGQSAMDSRFLSTYDPTLDVQIDSEGHDDFNDAVEAYRDRQKWKQQGAERMRSAGFSDDFVKAWENNDTKNEANLKWTKKGATREWDRGKTLEDLDGGGGVDLRADWIKKK